MATNASNVVQGQALGFLKGSLGVSRGGRAYATCQMSRRAKLLISRTMTCAA